MPNSQKKMLAVISTLAPYKPNADSLASEIGISRNSVQDYLALLERAQLLGLLRNDVKDDIEFAQGNVIPLSAFGLTY